MDFKIFCRLLLITSIVTSCNKEEGTIPENTILHTFNNIEEMPIAQQQEFPNWNATGWGVYKDIIFEGTTIDYSLNFNETLEAEIISGDKYNNVFFTNTIATRWEGLDWYFNEATTFEYELDFYPNVGINCLQPDLSEVEGFEFTMQHVITPNSWGWGLQWSKTNTWSYWDDTKINNEVVGWVNLNGINNCINLNQWNTIKIIGVIENNTVIYREIVINTENYLLNIAIDNAEVPNGWFENFIQVGFQINGNEAIRDDHGFGVDPVSVYLNNINLSVTN